MSATVSPLPITGRCYCGRISLVAEEMPSTVAYCHCTDCRRVTGAPVAAFAAFAEGAMHFTPDAGQRITVSEDAERSFCPQCGSPIMGRYRYLPGAIYVPLGLLDQAELLPPRLHAHADNKLCWLTIQDNLERVEGSARTQLNPWVPGPSLVGGQMPRRRDIGSGHILQRDIKAFCLKRHRPVAGERKDQPPCAILAGRPLEGKKRQDHFAVITVDPLTLH